MEAMLHRSGHRAIARPGPAFSFRVFAASEDAARALGLDTRLLRVEVVDGADAFVGRQCRLEVGLPTEARAEVLGTRAEVAGWLANRSPFANR